MSKLAQAVEETNKESSREASSDDDWLFLKKQREDEIRTRLDRFARELSRVSKLRTQN